MTKKVAKIPAISRFVLVPWCINDDPQNPGQISSRTRPHDACQGRQPRSPGSDVTATANNNNFDRFFNKTPKLRSNLTWHSNILAVKDLPKNNHR